MRRALQSDVLKILAYMVISLLTGALLAPWLYTAGKALAEVSQGKATNGFIEWLSASCRKADFPIFFNRALMISAFVLVFPLIQWLNIERGKLAFRDTPWSLRLPEAAVAANVGQPLKRNQRGPLSLLFGFVIAASSTLLMGLLLVQAGAFVWRQGLVSPGGVVVAVDGWKVVRSAMGPAAVVSLIEEVLFRGVLLGLFMRAMRPRGAIISVSVLFAFVHFLQPPFGVMVPDPESPIAGLWLIGQMMGRFAQPIELVSGFGALLAVGLVLAYARWRTASLWLPIGLHAGWIFGVMIFKGISLVAPGVSPASRFLFGSTLREGLVPSIMIIATGVAVHWFTKPSHGAARSAQ